MALEYLWEKKNKNSSSSSSGDERRLEVVFVSLETELVVKVLDGKRLKEGVVDLLSPCRSLF